MIRILRHCDDMGATPSMTRRIVRAWREGLLEGFSVFGNGDALGLVCQALEVEPHRPVRLAVHLNLSEGPSLVPPGEVPLLVGPHGLLRHTFTDLLGTWLRSSRATRQRLLGQVEAEWSAQIAAVQAVAGARGVQAVDSHMHVHMLPFLLPVAAHLTAAAGIPELRLTAEPLHREKIATLPRSRATASGLAKHLLLRGLARSAGAVRQHHDLSGPDRFVGALYTGRMTSEAAAAGVRAAQRRGASSVELLFHIGRAQASERARWADRPEVGSFVLDEGRDREYLELQRYSREA